MNHRFHLLIGLFVCAAMLSTLPSVVRAGSNDQRVTPGEAQAQASPSSTAAPTPTTRPAVSISFQPPSQTVVVGSTGRVSVVGQAPPEGIGTYEITVAYDPTLITVTNCSSPLGPCNTSAPGGVEFVGLSLGGAYGFLTLGTVSFIGILPGSAPITVTVNDLTDPTGNALPVGPIAPGSISIITGVSPSPRPSPMPTASPTVSISFQPANQSIAAGSSGTIALVTQAPPQGIGTYEITVAYDPSFIYVTNCFSPLGPCNFAFPGSVRLIGITLAGARGMVTLGTVTFIGIVRGSDSVTAIVNDLTDPDGNDLPALPITSAGVTVTGGPTSTPPPPGKSCTPTNPPAGSRTACT
ncbi:MAG: cohesin domain-containing protein, partial [Dehalococcoidia bacterium]